ncbi:MAG: peptidoglycan bridge formation glycyltransferase FemA/FemB family protein [Candidatus Saccharibacteria bacterium]|nr:peptidoglycan bridge formation glycyltransferase FemA/FemB family protein [Candidatus Saccharibacteria bacterium]
MNRHLLQSEIWAEYERLDGKRSHVVEYEWKKKKFSTVAWENETPFGKYLMVGYGPRAQDKHELKQALEELRSLAKATDAYFVRIEPTLRLEPSEMAKIASGMNPKVEIKKVKNIDPEHTWVLDLRGKSQEDILGGMESRKVRYWKAAAKKGITMRVSEDPSEITILSKLLEGLGEMDHFTPQTESHLRHQMEAGFAKLYIADLDEGIWKGEEATGKTVPIAAALIYDFEGVRYYAHAATDSEHRKLMAGTVLLIQMILDAREQGMDTYDFWGITTSEDPNHPWYGFSKYKRSFGGRQVDYSGTYDMILKPAKYKLYNSVRNANLKVRKIFK